MNSKVMTCILLGILFLLIAAGGYLISSFTQKPVVDELQMAVVVVVAIAALMGVLFIIAAGFSAMNLTDRKQALGLPEGSIRAMIALVLIMVFVIFGIYLFRMIGYSGIQFVGHMQTLPESGKIGERPIVAEQATEPEYKDKGWYDVYVATEASDDAKKLAQQLITTVGTLVVAIASFYFGSAVTSSAAKKEREEIAAAQADASASNLVINDITPKEGTKGNEIGFEIAGTGFTSPKAVRLLRGSETMEATEVLSNATKIQCKIKIDKEPDGKWDMIVDNGDGKQARAAEIFTINKV
jgi:hypothetical protein